MNFKIKPSIVILIGLLSLAGLFLIAGCGSDEKKTETASAEEGQLWTCGMHPEVIVDEPGQCPKCGMNLVPVKNTQAGKQQATEQTTAEGEKKDRKILYWQAPMNPTEIYDHPGKSAMGMDLIPVYEDEAGLGSGGVVRINPAVVQNMGVRSVEVQRMDFTRQIRTVGKVNYNEDRLYDVNTKISGWVEKLYVNFTGEFVKKGQPLLEIYSPELVTTQEEYLLALKNQQLVEQSSFQAIKEGAET
ncbi:MAG: efflux RND transporter periplasmic adaptor subunit, partial [Calditrichia bacterium]